MPFTKDGCRLLAGAVAACGVLAACVPLLGSEPMAVTALKPDAVVQAEEPPVQPRANDWGVAAMPSKFAHSGPLLNVPRPEGKRLDSTAEMRDRIQAELGKYLGPVLGRKEVVASAEVYDHVLSEAERNSLVPLPIRKASGEVYFIAVQIGDYKVQILGELGQFISVLVRLPENGQSEWPAACRLLVPAVDPATLKQNNERYTKGVVDDCLVDNGLTIRTGARKSPQGAFYGLRVDIDVPKLKAAAAPAAAK
jgi:hypothetical protein